ncbi:LPS export ABC transporter periplasmic protein LptC [candidate division KSB1 bacterium]
MKKRILSIFLIALLCMYGAGGCSRQKEMPPENPHEPQERLPDQEARPFMTRISYGGIKSVEVNSGYMVAYTDKDSFFLSEGVKADFYDNRGNHTSRLVSDHAVINKKKDIMVARGDVTVTSDSGYVLLTEELFWNAETEKIYTDDFVTLIQESDTLYGEGFESDRSLKNYVIFKPSGVHVRNAGKQK